MRYYALACDYDGTLAHYGRVNAETLAALERVLATGRKLLLVTGRELDDLKTVFTELHLFAWIVAENGALLYCPATRQERVLAPPPPEGLIRALRRRGVSPLSVGRSIVATWVPHETAAVEASAGPGVDRALVGSWRHRSVKRVIRCGSERKGVREGARTDHGFEVAIVGRRRAAPR